jgi:hypothetical protein
LEDFEVVKDTIKEIVLRLTNPTASYNLVVGESDDQLEVRVESQASLEPIFVFVVDAERFRILKDLKLNPDGYLSVTYKNYFDLLSRFIEHWYPILAKLNQGYSIQEMVSQVFGETIRIWKDVIRVICNVGGVEYYDFGGVMRVINTDISYDVFTRVLKVHGQYNDELKCSSVMQLVVALLLVLGYVFQVNDADFNPILPDELVSEGEDITGMVDAEGEAGLGAEIGQGIEDGLEGFADEEAGFGEADDSLEGQFQPIENTAPDLEAGQEQLLEEAAGV